MCSLTSTSSMIHTLYTGCNYTWYKYDMFQNILNQWYGSDFYNRHVGCIRLDICHKISSMDGMVATFIMDKSAVSA